MPVTIGLERLLSDQPSLIEGRRLGLLCNPVSVDRRFRHAADLLAAAAGQRLVRLFGPEHGIRGVAQDMVPVGHQTDPVTGLPVVSLYGTDFESLRPRQEDLRDLDVLVCDLQDVGSRYYTYAWTALLCLEVCAQVGVTLVVCDRPNPLGGVEVEGGSIEPGFESFVGLHSVPNRHGMTLGELLRLCGAERRIDAALEVVPMTGWTREMDHEATGRPWVMPSPNMPTPDTAFVYPGMCLVEATELSEGRGTTRPFELVGAPFIEPPRLAAALEERGLPGVSFRPTWFLPQFQKHRGRDCGGVQLHVTDRGTFQPYRTALELLWVAKRLYPEHFSWRSRPYEFVGEVPAIDLLTGSAQYRRATEGTGTLQSLMEADRAESHRFRERRQPYLLY
jgi:uncharacterized protein YbbC (DUF1343 family)